MSAPAASRNRNEPQLPQRCTTCDRSPIAEGNSSSGLGGAGNQSRAFMVCSRCRSERCCSKECQRVHWRMHKEECQEYELSPIITPMFEAITRQFLSSRSLSQAASLSDSPEPSAQPESRACESRAPIAPVIAAAAAAANSTPSFKVEHVPGKGNYGIIAIRDFEAGDIVLEDKALFYIEMSDLTAATIKAKVASLPKSDQEKFYELWSWRMDDSASYEESILHTNVLPLGTGTTKGGLFLLAALFNHSCQFNVCHFWSENKKREVIVAARSIKKGEEMCIQYNGDAGTFGTRQQRQAVTDKAFGFQCKCNICELKGEALENSDFYRKMVTDMDKLIPDIIRRGDFIKGIWFVKEQLKVLEELTRTEKIVNFAQLSRSCYDAYQAAHAAGDMDLMKLWMGRTYEYSLMVCGRDPNDATVIRFGKMRDQLRRGEIPPLGGYAWMSNNRKTQ